MPMTSGLSIITHYQFTIISHNQSNTEPNNKTMMQPATPKSQQSEPTSSDEMMERISLHCHENSPIPSQLSCVTCQSLNIKCTPRRNSKGLYVGCQHCLHSRELSSNCSLAHSDDLFITYRRIFQERIPATDNHDARHVCYNHEDPPMFNAFHPAPLDPIERTLVKESVDERSLHKPSGPDYPGNHHFAVDERLLHKPVTFKILLGQQQVQPKVCAFTF